MSARVAVVGAGVSGLATAYELARRGHHVTVLERQVRTGGSAVSERIGGFLVEHGPSAVNGASAQAAALSRELRLEGIRCALGPGVRYRYLVNHHELQRIATHPFAFLTSAYLSPAARLRMAAEVFLPRKPTTQEETVAEFWRRRFGPEFAERVIDPVVGGLCAGVAEGLSMPAVFPSVAEMERRHRSVAWTVARRALRGAEMPGRRLFSWTDGVASLPHALADRLGPAVRTGIAVRRIRRIGSGFRIEAGHAGAFEVEAVVVATQPHVAAALLEDVDPTAAAAAASFEAPPLAVVFLGYRREQVAHPLDGLGFLVPRGEKLALAGAQFRSTMFACRAPAGHVALAGYLGGARAPALAGQPAEELAALAREEFRDLLGVRGEPVVTRVRQWARGLPQYRPGHAGRVAELRASERRVPGLFVTGNYFAGLSVAACLAQAAETAARVEATLIGWRTAKRPVAPASRASIER